MRKTGKLLKVLIVMLFIISCFFPFINNNVVEAATVKDELVYISFGDSIAAGFGLDGHTEEIENNHIFIENSYAKKFSNMLNEKYDNVSSYTFANSGDKVEQLLSILNNNDVVQLVQKAKIITICIGANNVLGPATDMLPYYILGSTSEQQMVATLTQELANFQTKFAQLLNRLDSLNSKCNYIFTNVYNPYKDFQLTEEQMAELQSYNSFIDWQRINTIEPITENIIGGTGGLNQMMATMLSGKNNYYLVDTKQSFDNYPNKYSNLVNANSDEVNANNINQLMASISNPNVASPKCIDPHPTLEGHNLIYNQFKNVFDNNLVFVQLDYNEGSLNNTSNKIDFIKKGTAYSAPSANQLPTKNKSSFVGWYESLLDNTPFDFNQTITTNKTLYAKWEQQSYIVTFNSNGGTSVASQNVMVDEKVTKPTDPTKQSYTFMGWYKDAQFQNQWNFNSDVVTDNITLYAKWDEVSFTVSFNSNGGTSVASQRVVQNQTATQVANPTRYNYSFLGWYYDNNTFRNEFSFNSPITSNITLYAKWVEQCTVRFETFNNSYNFETVINKGGIMSSPNINREHYIVYGWFKEPTLQNEFDFNSPITKDMTLYAKYSMITCNENLLTQTYSGSMQNITFNIETKPEAQIVWLVDNQSVQENNTNSYTFTPTGIGNHIITCKINNKFANTLTVSVNYEEPTKIEVERHYQDDKYTLTIKNTTYQNPNNYKWFKQNNQSGQLEYIGSGTSITIDNEDAKIVARYVSQSKSISENINIEKYDEIKMRNNLIILIGIAVIALGVVIYITYTIIKKVKTIKKYGYY